LDFGDSGYLLYKISLSFNKKKIMGAWKPATLTASSRPTLLPGESELAVQANVGLYENKLKAAVPYQAGRVYLTTHRIIYVPDEESKRRAIELALARVQSVELFSGFMRSSPKITIRVAPLETGESMATATAGKITPDVVAAPLEETESTWVCPICFFANTLPKGFDFSQPLPVCVTCGIPATREVIQDSAKISAILPNSGQSSTSIKTNNTNNSINTGEVLKSDGIACPRCTFVNHPSMNMCEICGARLISPNLPTQLLRLEVDPKAARLDAFGYVETLLLPSTRTEPATSYKLSFRSGGERLVYEQLKVSLAKVAWKTDASSSSSSRSSSTSLNKSTSSHVNDSGNVNSRVSSTNGSQIALGIHGLQLSTEHERDHNKKVLGSALEDLNSLMLRAQEVVRLAERYAKVLDKQDTPEARKARQALQYSTKALGISSIDSSTSSDDATFHAELARQIADFLLSVAPSPSPSGNAQMAEGVLASEGGIITLIDLFAVYNRARGVSLISPTDLYQACLQFDKLGLGIRLRTFASGLRVIQESYRTEEVITRNILEIINKRKMALQAESGSNNRNDEYCGITAIYVSEKLKWSVMIATEELEMAERNGTLCRDDQLSGTTFYENDIPTTPWNWRSELFNE
jgi:ESCRT-II complex subunit VPS36